MDYSYKEKIDILYKRCVEQSDLQASLLWKRFSLFWAVVSILFVAYSQKDVAPSVQLLIASFGLVSSFSWSLINRGSAYLDKLWLFRLRLIQEEIFRGELPLIFGKKKPREYLVANDSRFFGAKGFSVSLLASALSDFSIAAWVVLMVRSYLTLVNGQCILGQYVSLRGCFYSLFVVAVIAFLCVVYRLTKKDALTAEEKERVLKKEVAIWFSKMRQENNVEPAREEGGSAL